MSFLKTSWKKFQFTKISIFSKIASFYPNLIIFFQWKLRVHTFQILSCARARAHAPKPHFLKILWFWNFQWISSIQSKIGARACARRREHYKIRKVWTFSFHWKKQLLILNDSWWFWTILKTHEMIMNFWKTAMSFSCIFY